VEWLMDLSKLHFSTVAGIILQTGYTRQPRLLLMLLLLVVVMR